MTKLTDSLNKETYKYQAKMYEKSTKDILRAIINKVPRELLIKELVRKKIIMRNWNQKGNKYTLRKDGKN